MKNKLEKLEKEHEFQVNTLKKENQFLKEKLDYKATLEVSTKGLMKSKDESPENVEVEKLKDDIKSLKEQLETVRNLFFYLQIILKSFLHFRILYLIICNNNK